MIRTSDRIGEWMPTAKVERILNNSEKTLEELMAENPAIGSDKYILDNMRFVVRHADKRVAMVVNIVRAICEEEYKCLDRMLELKRIIKDDEKLIDAIIESCEANVKIESVINTQCVLNSFFRKGMDYSRLKARLSEYYTPKMFHKTFDEHIDSLCEEFNISSGQVFP